MGENVEQKIEAVVKTEVPVVQADAAKVVDVIKTAEDQAPQVFAEVKSEASKIVVQAENMVKADIAAAKSVVAKVETTVKADVVKVESFVSETVAKQQALVKTLTNAFEAKKQELEDVIAKDAEAAKTVAQNYIKNAINSIEAQLLSEKVKLAQLETESVAEVKKGLAWFVILWRNLKTFFTKVL